MGVTEARQWGREEGREGGRKKGPGGGESLVGEVGAKEFHRVEGRERGKGGVRIEGPTCFAEEYCALDNEGGVARGEEGGHMLGGEGGQIRGSKHKGRSHGAGGQMRVGVRNGQESEHATGERRRREAPLKERALKLSCEGGDVNESKATTGTGLGQGIVRNDLRDATSAITNSRTYHRVKGGQLLGSEMSEAKDVT